MAQAQVWDSQQTSQAPIGSASGLLREGHVPEVNGSHCLMKSANPCLEFGTLPKPKIPCSIRGPHKGARCSLRFEGGFDRRR